MTLNSPKTWSHKTLSHTKTPLVATPTSAPNLTRKNVVLPSSRYERSTVIEDVLLCSGKNTPFFKSLNKFGFLTLNIALISASALKKNENLCLVYVVLENCTHYRVVTWYNGRFYELSFKT